MHAPFALGKMPGMMSSKEIAGLGNLVELDSGRYFDGLPLTQPATRTLLNFS
jgi:hypothetical protein